MTSPAPDPCYFRVVLRTRIDTIPSPLCFLCTKLLVSAKIFHFFFSLFFFHFTQPLLLISLLPQSWLPQSWLPKNLVPQLTGERARAGPLALEHEPPNPGTHPFSLGSCRLAPWPRPSAVSSGLSSGFTTIFPSCLFPSVSLPHFRCPC